MKRVLHAWIPTIAYMGLIFFLSAQPTLPQPSWIFSSDKLQHIIAYIGLALVILRSVLMSPLANRMPYLQSFVLAILYAASDEFHQSFVPGRSAELADWLADVIGICVGTGFVYAYLKNRKGSEK